VAGNADGSGGHGRFPPPSSAKIRWWASDLLAQVVGPNRHHRPPLRFGQQPAHPRLHGHQNRSPCPWPRIHPPRNTVGQPTNTPLGSRRPAYWPGPGYANRQAIVIQGGRNTQGEKTTGHREIKNPGLLALIPGSTCDSCSN